MSGIVVLISGRGSNLRAICDTSLQQQIKCVISNKSDAEGIQFAKSIGLATYTIEPTKGISREEFDKSMADIIDSYKPDLIVLAGFMRILSSWFVNQYINKLINIHPSILPAFAGTTHAQLDALNAKVKVSGATVHFVHEEVDSGPIIAQGVVGLDQDDTEQSLNKRILELEHTIYPFVIHKLINNQFTKCDNNIFLSHHSSDKSWLGKFFGVIFY